MKKEKIRSIFFAGSLLIISLLNIITPAKVFSSKEGRYLQGLPQISWEKVIANKFGKEFEKYTTDQFMGRNNWISLKTISDLSILKKDNGRVYFGKNDYLFNVENELDKEQFNKNINYINKFIEDIKAYNEGIDIKALLVPSKEIVLKDKLPLYAPTLDEKSILNEIQSLIKGNMQILDLIQIFGEKSSEYIYYKTDHHWTSLGAYYAYEYFLKESAMKPLNKEDFDILEVSKDFLGTNYRKAIFYKGIPDEVFKYNTQIKNDVEILYNESIKGNNLYDENQLKGQDKYSYFLGGDKAVIKIDTSIKNGKNILIIKDSFANSLIPFLTNHYEDIFIIDPRYYNMSIKDFVKENQIEEILFLFNIQTFVQEKTLSILNK